VERVVEALTLSIRSAAFADLAPAVLYGILRVRSVAFVVEQDCVYLDADGRDMEDGAVHLWVEDEGEVVACARILREDVGASIGRLVTAPTHRARGLGEAVMQRALELAPRPARIHAQSHLAGWYGRMGFAVCGPDFLEDGIPHTPMVVGVEA
jgi:ElaA protein